MIVHKTKQKNKHIHKENGTLKKPVDQIGYLREFYLQNLFFTKILQDLLYIIISSLG